MEFSDVVFRQFLPIDVMLDEYNAEMNKLVRLQKIARPSVGHEEHLG